MTEENLLPPFSIENGYPFISPVSHETYPPEKRFGEIISVQDGLIHFNRETMEDKLGLEHNSGDQLFHNTFMVKLANSVLESEHALLEAENQINDMMKDLPFVPESFQFEKVVAPGKIEDDPITIYKSKLESGVLLTKVVGENNKWIIMKDGLKIELLIPCERVGTIIFYSLGIKIREEE